MSREGLSAPASDRERRALLEQLQTELREARSSLAKGGDDPLPSLLELETELINATARGESARTRVVDLEAQLDPLTVEVRKLGRDLEEETVLALGKSRRDRYVDWAPKDTVASLEPARLGSRNLSLSWSYPLLLGVFIAPLLIYGLAAIFVTCGK
jgi:autotransporter translocation and assembly factor TamB